MLFLLVLSLEFPCHLHQHPCPWTWCWSLIYFFDFDVALANQPWLGCSHPGFVYPRPPWIVLPALLPALGWTCSVSSMTQPGTPPLWVCAGACVSTRYFTWRKLKGRLSEPLIWTYAFLGRAVPFLYCAEYREGKFLTCARHRVPALYRSPKLPLLFWE